MKKILIFIIVSIFTGAEVIWAQPVSPAEQMKYRRSSIYSLMIKHENQKYADTIANVFTMMPVPDKYNDHDLSVKVIGIEEKTKRVDPTDIESFLNKNGVASRLVSKWFDRDFTNGVCNVEMVKERGLYSASEKDKALAAQSLRGTAMLEDAGEELIGNTFVIVNDIRYIDKAKKSKTAGIFIRVLGVAAAAVTGSSDLMDAADDWADIAESFKGFRVKVYTHLYQLVWDDEIADNFYRNMYSDTPDEEKKKALEANRDKFTLKYVGTQESSGSTTSFLGIREDQPEVMVRKACQRALDENVANLQKNFDQFKVKVPLLSTDPITAQIGKKEGITGDSKFEVLEVQINDGKTEYKRVGVIKPVPHLIWDNRFMAVEERAVGAKLGCTTFTKVSGSDFYPGMLIREIK